MGIWEKLLSKRLEFSALLLQEAAPLLTAEPQAWARQVGENVTYSATLAALTKRQIPGLAARLPVDVVVFHRLPTAIGLVHAVQSFSGPTLLPTDFHVELPVSIPRAAWAKKGPLVSKWVTSLTEQNQSDPFAGHLNDGMERGQGWKADSIINYANKWSFNLGSIECNMPFTMQIVPLGTGTCLYLFKRPFQPGMWSAKQIKFHLSEFLMLASWLREGLEGLHYAGPPASAEVPVLSYSLMAIAPLQVLFENLGQQVDWPVEKPAVRKAGQ